jgi:protein involved in polysaccharide export with SLBB domain
LEFSAVFTAHVSPCANGKAGVIIQVHFGIGLNLETPESEKMRLGIKWFHAVSASLMLGGLLLSNGCASNDMEFFKSTVSATEPKIRPGLTLKVSLSTGSNKPDDYAKEVSVCGEVTLPQVGAVKCKDMTLGELQDALKKAYQEYYKEPTVTVQFMYGDNLLSPWGYVRVMGKVSKEGPVNIPPTRDLTVTRALQLAGGVTPLGDQSSVRITRTMTDGKKRQIILNLEEIGKNGYVDRDIVLQENDVVYVPEIFW